MFRWLSRLISSPDNDTSGRYCYYQLFKDGRPLPSRRIFDKKRPAFGRIPVVDISPPKSIQNLQVCLADEEGFATPDVSITTPNSATPLVVDLVLSSPPIDLVGKSASSPFAVTIRSGAVRQALIPWTFDANGIAIPKRDLMNRHTMVLSTERPPGWNTALVISAYSAGEPMILKPNGSVICHLQVGEIIFVNPSEGRDAQ
ncbi:hypothetical protein DL93DRAFT_2103382 [Clavulina sp. PMI_390]|nr:hypothetical protein DL93DRAFT_2103382 [Clavulina sp. PMI_390]